MGKIEDMRRLREQQFAETEQRRASSAKARPEPAAPSPPPPPSRAAELEKPEPTRTGRSTSPSGSAAQGKCPECGKMKPLQGDVMASHQKGFGKACPGSRKDPV